MTSVPLGPGAEFDRIRAIAAALGSAGRGLGDDAALLAGGWCASVDLSVEGTHFRRDWLSLEEIGWRAAAAALSDLAAMGAAAEALLVGVAIPREASSGDLIAIMAGVGAVATSVGATVVGGDVTAGPALMISVTVLGRADRPVGRAGARVGDGVWITGTVGGAHAALLSWQAGRDPGPSARRRFARPEPRVEAGRWLAAQGARAMIDLSDGLAGDVRHLAAAGDVGVDITLENVPLDPDVTAAAVAAGVAPEIVGARGGEDYELLAVMPSEFDPSGTAGAHRLVRIGTITNEPGVRLLLDGRPVTIAGFDHFG